MTGEFELAVHRAAAPDTRDTACWSPFSVTAVLGLACACTSGQTRDELVAALTDGDSDIDSRARLMRMAAEPEGDGELAVANTAWLRADLESTRNTGSTENSENSASDALAAWPSAAVRGFDLDPRLARRTINDDVAGTTRGLIPELVGENALTERTYAVLVSALYLKASWVHPFTPQATGPRRFDTPSGPVRVPTMELVADVGYADTGRWQVVTLPTTGGVDASILLPQEPLDQAEPALAPGELGGLLGTHPSRRVRLRLPRLRVSWRGDLADALPALGIRCLFDQERADLSGLTPVRPVWVSNVLHQAVLRVDESGLEGAAATAVIVAGRALATPPAEPLLVAVDRPFLLLVRHRRTGVCYFLARVTDPTT